MILYSSTTGYLEANMSMEGNFSENLTALTPFNLTDTLGQFSPDSVCFSSLTQQQTYYICLVSVIVSFQCCTVYCITVVYVMLNTGGWVVIHKYVCKSSNCAGCDQ